jgi:hypothetical protein
MHNASIFMKSEISALLNQLNYYSIHHSIHFEPQYTITETSNIGTRIYGVERLLG